MWTHRGKEQGFVLKIDYEKAYDWVNVEFFEELMRMRGFGLNWIYWVHRFSWCDNLWGSFDVFLFAKMMMKFAKQCFIKGLLPDFGDRCSSLQ